MGILQTYLEATKSVTQEYANIELPLVAGNIPEALQGTLFRNGNGRFEHQGVKYDHLFDGDGMIAAFRFKNGKVTYSNRYVRTKEFEAEEQRGKMLYRSFGTNLPGGFSKNLLRMRFKNAANTSLVYHAGKLLALWEGGLPHEIDPETLATLSRYDYNGVLQNSFSALDKVIFPELSFSAHPKIHPETGVLYNFGTVPGLKHRLVLYKIEPNGKAAIEQVITMPGMTFAHDFILTQQHKKIFFLPPVEFNIVRTFVGLDTPVGSIRVNKKKKTTILIVDNQKLKRIETDFGFIFHYAGGYEEDENTLVIDAPVLPDFPTAKEMKSFLKGKEVGVPKGILTRHRIHMDTGKVEKEILSDHYCELGEIHPEKTGQFYDYFWSMAGAPNEKTELLTGIQKVAVQEKTTTYRSIYPCLPSEPVFVPHPNATKEDEGWILILKFNPEQLQTTLVIMDGSDLTPLAELKLPHNIPLGFHGLWMD